MFVVIYVLPWGSRRELDGVVSSQAEKLRHRAQGAKLAVRGAAWLSSVLFLFCDSLVFSFKTPLLKFLLSCASTWLRVLLLGNRSDLFN